MLTQYQLEISHRTSPEFTLTVWHAAEEVQWRKWCSGGSDAVEEVVQWRKWFSGGSGAVEEVVQWVSGAVEEVVQWRKRCSWLNGAVVEVVLWNKWCSGGSGAVEGWSQFIHDWVASQAVRWHDISKVTCSRLTRCSKSCDYSPHLHLRISGGISGGTTSQVDLPSMTPFSVAGCGRLQLLASHCYFPSCSLLQ